ncbi:MAG: PAS domain S-box protein [Planctomycetales bacterium]|nr:PAS domain S-box protein [Planctomycetales bacterium]
MVVDGQFTLAAIFFNVGGGIFMIAAAGRYMQHYYSKQQNHDDLLFALHCLLFGGAAIMFEQSQLWDFSWWWWHLLRLLAYTVALTFAVQAVLQLQFESKRLNEIYTLRYEHAQHEAYILNTELTHLRMTLDRHMLVSVTDKSGRIVEVNKGFCLISGYDENELIGQNHRIINSGVHPKEFWIGMWKTVSSGKAWRGEICNRAKDGSLYWVDSTIVPWTDGPDQSPKRYVSLRFDITEKKRVEEELRSAQKLESIGRLAAGIAHEINTPMQFIECSVTYLSQLMDEWVSLNRTASNQDHRDGEVDVTREKFLNDKFLKGSAEALEDCQLGVKRVVEIVGAMKEFAHPGSNDSMPFDVNHCIQNAATITRNMTKQHAVVELNLSACALVQGSASGMNQALVNLIMNAADAIEEASEGGVITGRITITSNQNDDQVVIKVSDTGCGMAPEVASRAFDPFFTTKGVGKGSGQGLAIVYNAVVDKCGGEIKIDSAFGEGTTFTIYLPTSVDRFAGTHVAPRHEHPSNV